MQFDWDTNNIDHIALHDVTTDEAEQVIENKPLDAGVVFRNAEPRTLHLGETDTGRVLLVVITERNEMFRVVTARPANRKERTFYSNHKATINDKDSTES